MKDRCKQRCLILMSIIFIIGVLWLLNETKVISLNLPWAPIILIISTAGLIGYIYTKDK